jgi:hypothetical protein
MGTLWPNSMAAISQSASGLAVLAAAPAVYF